MAPKTLYNAAEVQQKVTETAEKAFKTLEEEGWEFSESTEITCEYLGAATADGYTLDRKPTLRCTVGFKWSYRDESTNESLTKRVRYDYYLSHGITSSAGRQLLSATSFPASHRKLPSDLHKNSHLRP